MPPWPAIDTIMFDMDGTLLDLHFDNYFWLILVPKNYANNFNISEEEADARLAIAKNRLEKLESFDTSKLNEQEKLSLRLYKLGIERDLANDEFRHHRYIVHQFRAAHTQVPSFLINGQANS